MSRPLCLGVIVELFWFVFVFYVSPFVGALVGYTWALRAGKTRAAVIAAAALGATALGLVAGMALGVSGMGLVSLVVPFQAAFIGATIGALGIVARALGAWLQRRP